MRDKIEKLLAEIEQLAAKKEQEIEEILVRCASAGVGIPYYASLGLRDSEALTKMGGRSVG